LVAKLKPADSFSGLFPYLDQTGVTRFDAFVYFSKIFFISPGRSWSVRSLMASSPLL